MRAVIWTDVIQFALYLTGSVAAFFLLLHKIPGGWPEVTQAAAAAGGKLTIFDFTFSLTQSYTFWSGLLGGTFLTMASHGTDQTMVQRLLAARNERDSKTALLASGVIVFVAVRAVSRARRDALRLRAARRAASSRGRSRPHFSAIHRARHADRPRGLGARFDLCDCDVQRQRLVELARFLQHHRPRRASAAPRESQVASAARAGMTLVWGVVLGLLGLIHWGPVLVAGLTIASITYGGLLGVFLLGTWNRRANETGALIGIRGGHCSHDRHQISDAAGLDLVRSGRHDHHVRGRLARKRSLVRTPHSCVSATAVVTVAS